MADCTSSFTESLLYALQEGSRVCVTVPFHSVRTQVSGIPMVALPTMACLSLPVMKTIRPPCGGTGRLWRTTEQASKLFAVLTECFLEEGTLKMKFGKEADNQRKHPGKKETVQKDTKAWRTNHFQGTTSASLWMKSRHIEMREVMSLASAELWTALKSSPSLSKVGEVGFMLMTTRNPWQYSKRSKVWLESQA